MGPVAQLGAWGAAALGLACVLMVQNLRAWPLGLVLAAVLTAGIGGVQFVGEAARFAPWLFGAAAGEVMGNLRQRNQLASLLMMGMVSLMALLAGGHNAVVLAGKRGWRLGPGLSLCCGLCGLAALFAFGAALSGSRTGLVQWLAVLGLALVWRRSLGAQWAWLLSAAALGYVLGIVVAPWLADWLGHGNAGLLGRLEDANAFSRLALWGNVLELIAQKPLLGHGWGSLAYAHYSAEFSSPRFMELLDNAHNLPLHLAVELGLPVALAFCGLVGWLIWKNKPWAEARPDRQLAWGCLLVMGIHSLVEYPLWYGPFFMAAVICICILCSDLWKKWLVAGTKYRQFAIISGVHCAGVALLALTAFVAFDYHRVSQIYLQPEERSSWYADDALGAAKQSVLFKNHAKFAELVVTPLSRETAPRVLALSSGLIEWSPEPRVIEMLIESSVMMGLDDMAVFHLKRYRLAYPLAYAAWQRQQGKITSAL